MLKKSNGFTLLEIVISIAALSIISVFILRMFIAASNLNDRAKDTDAAISRSITEVEKLKNHLSLADYLELDAPSDVIESADSITVSFYYDSKWKQIIHPGGTVPRTAKYHLRMDIVPDAAQPPQAGGAMPGLLYDVNIEVADMSIENAFQLASMQTKKYFPDSLGDNL